MTMIYINGRFLNQSLTGVERYAYSICKTMAAMGVQFTIVCPHKPILPCYDTSDLHIERYGWGGSHFWEQCVLPFFFIGKKDYVMFSFTGLGPILVRNTVMTIHDLSFLVNPAWFSRAYYWWYKTLTPIAARASRKVITVSEFSKKELLRFYPFFKQNGIAVVYGAPDSNLFHTIATERPSERFVLAVSSLDPRKNFRRLIEAFKDISDCMLYIVGGSNSVFSETVHEGQQNIRYLGRVSDDELVRLYNQAECFVFPSIYEGFGLPPIEAMSCGCPTLVSDIPVLKEVCGDASIYFNPFCAKEIHDAILSYIGSTKEEKNRICQKGLENTNRFSWKSSVQRIIAIVHEMRNG